VIKIDDSDLSAELRVIREELRIIKTMLKDLLPVSLAAPGDLPVKILSTAQVRAMVPFSYGRLLNMRKAGLFPRAVKLGKKREGFLEKEVVPWIERYIAEQRKSSNGA